MNKISLAHKFGRIEHNFGRLMAIPIILNIIYTYLKWDIIGLALSSLAFICWAIYISSHTIEKRLYRGIRR
jgi:threonine/homoserine efflux transporter RhtA